MLAGAVSLMLAGIVIGVVLGALGDEAPGSPAGLSPTANPSSAVPTTTQATEGVDIPEPTPTAAEATLTYLDGDGSAVLVMHERASALAAAELDPDRCRDEASQLDEVAPSRDVAIVIGRIRDPVLRALLEAERRALGSVIAACISEHDIREATAADLALRAAAVEDRIQDLVATR